MSPSGAGAPAEPGEMEKTRAPEPRRAAPRPADGPRPRPRRREGALGREALVRGRPRPLPDARPPRPRSPGEPRARAAAREPRLLQRQPVPQPDEPLLGRLRPLRLGPQARRPRRLHDGDRGGRDARRRPAGTTGSPSSTSSAGSTRRSPTTTTRTSSARSVSRFPGVHLKAWTMVELDWIARVGKKDAREAILELKDAGMDSCPGGGAEIFAKRGPRRHLHEQDRRRDVARDRPRSATVHGREDERHDALRVDRDRRGTGRPPREDPRAAGRDEGLPRLHPARVPPGRDAVRAPSARRAGSSTCASSPRRASSSTTSTTSRPTGSRSARSSRRWRSTSAPTTSSER